MYLWPTLEKQIDQKNLAILTSRIVGDLIDRSVLTEVKNYRKDFEDNPFESVYGFYRILRHENLIRDD